MRLIIYLDALLIPLSLSLMAAYHLYLWNCIRRRPSSTRIGLDALKRKSWLVQIKEVDDKKGMLGVQSLRNTQMVTILTAAISILLNTALASLTNNAYSARHVFHSQLLGAKSPKIYDLKYGSASLFLLGSFLSSSAGLFYLIDANFLIINPCCGRISCPVHTEMVVERGFMLAAVGNRVLCISVPLLLWMFGPLAVALASGALLWVLYQLDFVG